MSNQTAVITVQQLDPRTRQVYRTFTYYSDRKNLDTKLDHISRAYNMANTSVTVK